MKVTEEVIIDLMPLYFSGEASKDTIALVDSYFEQNPEFAKQAKASKEQIINEDIQTTLTKEDEMVSLNKTKKWLRLRAVIMGLAIFFTLAPASVYNTGGTTRWLAIEAPMTALSYGLVGAVLWVIYFVMRNKLQVTEL